MKVLSSAVTKFLPGSLSLNFGQSGGAYCDVACSFHPHNSTDSAQPDSCYAVRSARLRPMVARSEENRQQIHPTRLVNMAIVELEAILANGGSVPWFRFSAAGSLPQREQIPKGFIAAVRQLIGILNRHSIPVHFPKEGESAEVYRAMVGDLVAVRRSFAIDSSAFIDYQDSASVVVGELGQSLPDKVAASRAVARAHQAKTGRKTVVCPAILSSIAARKNVGRPRVQCGTCTACAVVDFDIVYPRH